MTRNFFPLGFFFIQHFLHRIVASFFLSIVLTRRKKLHTKAMRLQEIFGLSSFLTLPVFWRLKQVRYNYPGFGSQKFCENKSKILPKVWNIPENVKNSGIFLTFSTFDSICQNLTVYFWHFPKIPVFIYTLFVKYIHAKNTLKPLFDSSRLY